MPAKSEKQRRFMGMVLAAKRGKLKKPSKAVKDAAGSMSEEDARDFARKPIEKTAKYWEPAVAGVFAGSAAFALAKAIKRLKQPKPAEPDLSERLATGVAGALAFPTGLAAVSMLKNMRKTAEEYVDAQLAKRASCGRSHGERAKNRAKHADKIKKGMYKQASDIPEIPENAKQRIDDAVDAMLRKMAADFFDPAPGRKGLFDEYGPGAVPQTIQIESLGDHPGHYGAAATGGLVTGAAIGGIAGDDPSDTITAGLVGAGVAPLLLAIYRMKRKQDFALDRLTNEGNYAANDKAGHKKGAALIPDTQPIEDRLDVLGGAAAGAGVGGLITGLTGDKPDYATGAILGGGAGALLTILAKMYTRNALNPKDWR